MTNDHPPPPDPVAADLRISALAHARSTGRSVSHALKKRQLNIRRSSIWNDFDGTDTAVPALPWLLQGKGSSGTPFKLYLLLLWLAGSKGGAQDRGSLHAHVGRLEGPHTAVVSFDDIADLLLIAGFKKRASNSGYRLIVSSLRKLRDEHLIELSDDEQSIRLLAEDRSGSPYSDPGSAYKETNSASDRYIKLPHEFFTSGWFSALPAPAILALLVHRWHWIDGRPRPTAFNEETLAKYVAVSKTTMTRGERLLTHWGVLERTEKRFEGKGRRSRYEYRLQIDAFKRDCPDKIPPTFR